MTVRAGTCLFFGRFCSVAATTSLTWETSTIGKANHARKPLLASLKRHLQGDFWMVELSVPELFSANRRKLGEVLLVSDTAPGVHRDFRNYVLARVPGHFPFHTGGDLVNPQFSFVPSGIAGHVPLYGCE